MSMSRTGKIGIVVGVLAVVVVATLVVVIVVKSGGAGGNGVTSSPSTVHEQKVAAFITAVAADRRTVRFYGFGPNISGDELFAAAKKRDAKKPKDGGGGDPVAEAQRLLHGEAVGRLDHPFIQNQLKTHSALVRVVYDSDGVRSDMVFMVMGNDVLPLGPGSDGWKAKKLKEIENKPLADEPIKQAAPKPPAKKTPPKNPQIPDF